jgi:HK97 family phage prohead protease
MDSSARIAALYAGDLAQIADAKANRYLPICGGEKDHEWAQNLALEQAEREGMGFARASDILDTAKARAVKIVTEKATVIAHVADLLLEQETMTGRELRNAMKMKPAWWLGDDDERPEPGHDFLASRSAPKPRKRSVSTTSPYPRDNLFRGATSAARFHPAPIKLPEDGHHVPAQHMYEHSLRDCDAIVGHMAVFNVWSEVSSLFEGHFMECIAPGAFAQTLKSREGQIRCLFQHGYDPYIGEKPLGPFDELREDDTGVFYEVSLLDTEYNAQLVPGLKHRLYGASFRFRVMREEWVEDPGASDYNPKGLSERTLKELTLYEGGPVTFGQYPEATAGMRSLTDEFRALAARHDAGRAT